MTPSLTPEQERLLSGVATGEIDPRAASVVEETRRSTDFASELQRMMDVIARFERAAAHSQEDIALARQETHAPGETAVERAVKDHLTNGRSPALRRIVGSRATTWLLAAAAVLLAVALYLRDDSDGPIEPRSTEQLGDALECLAPRGDVTEFREFRFAGTRPDGAWFEVVIRDSEGEELLRSPRLESNSFTPADPDLSRLPERIEWQVFLRDVGGIRGTSKASAKR